MSSKKRYSEIETLEHDRRNNRVTAVLRNAWPLQTHVWYRQKSQFLTTQLTSLDYFSDVDRSSTRKQQIDTANTKVCNTIDIQIFLHVVLQNGRLILYLQR